MPQRTCNHTKEVLGEPLNATTTVPNLCLDNSRDGRRALALGGLTALIGLFYLAGRVE